MQPKKKKHGETVSRRKFVAFWAGATLLAWAVIIGLGIPLTPILPDNMLVLSLLMGIAPALVLGWLQKQIMRFFLNADTRGWLRASLFGGLATGIALFAYISTPVNPMLSAIPLLIPLAAVQWFWLRSRVPNAWLWLGNGMLSALLFTLPAQVYFLGGLGEVMALLGFVMHLLVSGLVMHYLWTQPDAHQLDALESAADDALIARLSETTPDTEFDEDIEQRQHKRHFWGWLTALRIFRQRSTRRQWA